jgi:hypothetical protein
VQRGLGLLVAGVCIVTSGCIPLNTARKQEDAVRSVSAATQVARQVLDVIGVDQDSLAEMNVEPRECVDAFGRQRTVFYLDAVNDGFKVSITLSIDSLGRFRLTSRAQCGPSAGSRVDGFS